MTQEVNLDFKLFCSECFDSQYGFKANPINIFSFKPTESEYYYWKLSIYGGDTLDATELLMALKEEFDIAINDEIASEWTTVEQAVNYIRHIKFY